jgi:hypothetical protein
MGCADIVAAAIVVIVDDAVNVVIGYGVVHIGADAVIVITDRAGDIVIVIVDGAGDVVVDGIVDVIVIIVIIIIIIIIIVVVVVDGVDGVDCARSGVGVRTATGAAPATA